MVDEREDRRTVQEEQGVELTVSGALLTVMPLGTLRSPSCAVAVRMGRARRWMRR